MEILKSLGSTAEVLAHQYGVKTTDKVNPLADSVLTTVTRLLSNNPRRMSYLLINIGAANIYISPDNDVSSSKGILLVANGGIFSTNFRDDQQFPTKELFAIAIGATSSIYLLENIITP